MIGGEMISIEADRIARKDNVLIARLCEIYCDLDVQCHAWVWWESKRECDFHNQVMPQVDWIFNADTTSGIKDRTNFYCQQQIDTTGTFRANPQQL